MLCLCDFELYSRRVFLTIPTATQPILIAEKNSECKCNVYSGSARGHLAS